MRIGGLEGLGGEFDKARATIGEARAIMDDLGLHHQKAHSTDVAVLVEMLAEDYEAAEREARHAYAVLAEMGDRTYQATEALLVAEALELQGRTDEAAEWLAISNAIDETPDDPDVVVVQARLLARRGQLDEAIQLARVSTRPGRRNPGAVRRCALHPRPDPDPRGHNDEAIQAAEQCLERYEAKGIVPLIQKTNALLAEIRA